MLISELNKLLETLNEESINEKIMSKKKARRLKQQRAKLKAEKEAQKDQENDVIDAEIVEDEKEEPGTELIVYEEPNNNQFEDYDEISEAFKKMIEYFGPQLEKHKADIDKAMQIWEKSGKDKACPKEAWEILNNSINELKNEVETFVNQTDFDKMPEPEVLITDKVITGLNGYLEKAQKEIMAIKPDLVEDDFQAPAAASSTELKPTNTDVQADTQEPEEKTEPVKQKDKRKFNKIVNYQTFWKGFKDTYISLDGLWNGLKAISNAVKSGAQGIIRLAAAPVSWIDDRIWGFLTSPVAKDFIKTLAYSNPLTAFIFDGKLGSFGIGASIDKLHNTVKNIENKAQKVGKKDITKDKPENYDGRKFPKNISNLTLKQLKREFYSNKALVDCINISYNHSEVKKEDKALLRKNCNTIQKAFKAKKIDTVRKTFNTIITTLNNICDYMDWNQPSDWQSLFTRYVKAKGNTEKEEKKIKNINKSKANKKNDIPKQQPGMMTQAQWDALSDEEKAKYPEGIRKLYGESYSPLLKNLNKLLEAAEA